MVNFFITMPFNCVVIMQSLLIKYDYSFFFFLTKINSDLYPCFGCYLSAAIEHFIIEHGFMLYSSEKG